VSKDTRKGRGQMIGFLDNLEEYLDFEEEVDKELEKE
jgi:hypothetical protein